MDIQRAKDLSQGIELKEKMYHRDDIFLVFFLSIQGPSHVKLFLLCYDSPSHLVSCHHVQVEAQIQSVIKYLTCGSYFSVVRLQSKKGKFSALKHWITLVSCLALLRPEGNPGKPMHIYPASWMHFCLLCIQGLHLHQMQFFLDPPLHPLLFVFCDSHKI